MQKNNILMSNVIKTFSFEMPVLFLTFNRIKTAKLVFNEIKKSKPPRLYVASDGPRMSVDGEDKKVSQLREYILSNIDWDCEIYTLFNNTNKGCKIAVSNAVNWFFESEEMGIVLEDDCLPSESFFRYCQDLLYRYQYDERIYLITGYNKQNKWKERTPVEKIRIRTMPTRSRIQASDLCFWVTETTFRRIRALTTTMETQICTRSSPFKRGMH